MKNIFTTISLLFLIASQVMGQDKLPIEISDSQIRPLRSLADQNLQLKFEKELNQHPQWKKLIAQKKMAVGIVDLSDPLNVRFANVNGNDMMYAASLPKIAILLAAMDAIEKGNLWKPWMSKQTCAS